MVLGEGGAEGGVALEPGEEVVVAVFEDLASDGGVFAAQDEDEGGCQRLRSSTIQRCCWRSSSSRRVGGILCCGGWPLGVSLRRMAGRAQRLLVRWAQRRWWVKMGGTLSSTTVVRMATGVSGGRLAKKAGSGMLDRPEGKVVGCARV